MPQITVPQSLDPIVLRRPDGTSRAYSVKNGSVTVDDQDAADVEGLLAAADAGHVNVPAQEAAKPASPPAA